MSPALRPVMVVVLWCALGAGWSPGALIGGLAVALMVELLLGGTPTRLLRALPPAVRLTGDVLRDLVVSSCRIAWDVLRPRPQLRPRVVEVVTDLRSPHAITALANAISLTPGSLTLEADAERGRLVVHLCYGDEAAVWVRAIECGVASEIARVAAVLHPDDPPPRGSLELVP